MRAKLRQARELVADRVDIQLPLWGVDGYVSTFIPAVHRQFRFSFMDIDAYGDLAGVCSGDDHCPCAEWADEPVAFLEVVRGRDGLVLVVNQIEKVIGDGDGNSAHRFVTV
ncbi:MAG TPA: hypothetical protein VIM08_04205 [Arthrobacter sp.]